MKQGIMVGVVESVLSIAMVLALFPAAAFAAVASDAATQSESSDASNQSGAIVDESADATSDGDEEADSFDDDGISGDAGASDPSGNDVDDVDGLRHLPEGDAIASFSGGGFPALGNASPEADVVSLSSDADVARASVSAVLNANETVFCAAGRGGKLDGASGAKFAVWSVAGGQDDLRWYDAAHMPDGSWAMNAPVSGHRSTGLYNVHAYANVNGALAFAGSTSFTVSSPKASAVRMFQLSASQGTFTVYADGVSGAPISSVRVAVWANAGGQDDLRWYDAARVGGSYTFGAFMSQHRGQTGLYVADVYVKLANGIEVCIGRATAYLNVSGGSLSYRNDGDVSVTVSCRDGIYGLASGIRYAVWSAAGGQDDLRWYGASRMSDRSWPVAIPISNHRTAGVYLVHVYGTFSGVQTCIGSTSFTISANSASSVSTSLHDDNRGSFLVTVSGITAPSGVSKVEVPIWTKSNQSDIRWYQATRQSDGSYAVAVSATSHNLANYYYVHAYVTSKNGMRTYVGQASGSKLNLVHYAKVEGASGSGSRSVWIKNPPSTSVYVYVWSSSNGQDDLYRYSAAYMGDCVWKATIDCGNLKHSGTVNVHVYGGSTFYKALTFTAADSDVVSSHQVAMNNSVRGLSSSTDWLIAVDTSNCFVTVYRGGQGNWAAVNTFDCAPGALSTPSKKGVFRVGGKGYVFGSGYSCYYYTQYSGNYLFHSVLYYQGTYTIKDATMGRPASHGCIRLWIENAKYIYDNVPTGSTVLVY